MEASLRFLADDLLEGRGTPGRGLDLAALYLASELQQVGWSPGAGDSFFQSYTVAEFQPLESTYSVTIEGKKLEPQEFLVLPFGMPPGEVVLDLVFAGYGVVAPERQTDDLAGLDLRGKAVVSLLGAQWPLDPETPFGYDRAVGKSIEVTVRGGSLLVYVTEELAQGLEDPQSAEGAFFREMSQVSFAYLPEFAGRATMGIGPTLAITPEAFDRTLAGAAGATYEKLERRLAGGSEAPRPLDASLSLRIDAEPRTGQASNVAAVLRGRDERLRGEWVVLTAHYDHLGSLGVPEGEDGIWNGADDNASGTATVLEIARRLAAGETPRRSVLVLFTSGEERGLLGSAHYSRHPLVPYDSVVANINVDMVGRSSGSVQAIAHGSETLYEQATEIGARLGTSVEPDQQPSWRILYLTDHYHFARFDVPAIEFFTGLHPDYHQPSDEANRIRYEEMDRIVDIVWELTRLYTEGAEKPSFDRPEWFLTPE